MTEQWTNLEWMGPRPDGWPGALAWPPDPGEMLAVAGLYVGFGHPHRDDPDEPTWESWMMTDFRNKPEWLAERFRIARMTPEEIEAEELALEEEFMGSRAERTANGMPAETGWSSWTELARRLRSTRDFQLLANDMEERQRRGLSFRDKAWWDLELTKLAARETRSEGHLYEFLYRFSAVYPHGENRADTEEKSQVPFSTYHGYVLGTVRKALMETRPAFAAAPRRSVAELAKDPNVLVPPVAVAPRLAWEGRDTLFAGREKLAGKSTLWTAAAAAVTQGRPFLDAPTTKGRVLWVSADLEPEADVVQRFLRFGGDGAMMLLDYPSGDFATRLDALVRAVASLRPALLVVDSLSTYMLVDEASQSAEWNARFAAVRERLKPHKRTARAWLHHTTKGTGEYRDSTAIGANVDQILYYENPEPRGGTALRRVWGLGRVVGWRPFDVRLDGDAFAMDDDRLNAALDANEAASGDEPLFRRIRERPGEATAAIAAALGLNRQRDVEPALGRLEAAHRVEDRGAGEGRAHRSAWFVTGLHSPLPPPDGTSRGV